MGPNPSLADTEDVVENVLSRLMYFGLIVFFIFLLKYLCVRMAANDNRRVPHAIYTTTVTTQYPPTQPPVVVGTNSSMPVPTQF